jgi:hypothetical protein
MSDIEKLIEAAKKHGDEGEPDHEVGDLQEIARYLWSQLPLSSKKTTMEHFESYLYEWEDD